MSAFRLSALCLAIASHFALLGSAPLVAADFNPEATALPYPPDARDLEFTAWAGDIKFTSQSPLKSLAAFYLKEMASRGWEHVESAAEIEQDAIQLKFKHQDAAVELRLRQGSREVRVGLDCENLKFTGVDDPAKLAAAGIPVSRAALFLQKELPPPANPVNLEYGGDECTFKSALALTESFDHFLRLAQSKGFRESRRPIITGTRRYTEFKKGAAQLSVNVFSDAVGSRIILTYKDGVKETPIPPLAVVASLPIKGASADKTPPTESSSPSTGTTPIDVTSNQGSAAITYNGKQYTFANVAAFRTKSRGDSATMVVFSAKPIPLNKMQTLISASDDFSFGDLYEFSAPDSLVLQLGDHLGFQFTLPSLGVSNSIENAVNEIKIESNRVRGTLKMPPKAIFRNEPFSFTATVDAAIITPTTRISGPGDPVVRSDNSLLAEAPLAFPDGVENAGREGSKFRKTYKVLIRQPLADVDKFFRQELTAKGYSQAAAAPTGQPMQFKNDNLEFALTLKQQGGKTEVELLTRDIALARQEGILPPPGQGRVVFGNARNVAMVFTIGATNYSLKPGQGSKDYKEAINQSFPPGNYTITSKIAGRIQTKDMIELTADSTWGIIALPMGGNLCLRLY